MISINELKAKITCLFTAHLLIDFYSRTVVGVSHSLPGPHLI